MVWKCRYHRHLQNEFFFIVSKILLAWQNVIKVVSDECISMILNMLRCKKACGNHWMFWNMQVSIWNKNTISTTVIPATATKTTAKIWSAMTFKLIPHLFYFLANLSNATREPWPKAGVSNTRPAWCVCAARVKIGVFGDIKALYTLFCGRRRHFLSLCGPRAPFLSECGHRIDLSLRPLT